LTWSFSLLDTIALSHDLNQFISSILGITIDTFDEISKSRLIKEGIEGIFRLFFKLTLLDSEEHLIDLDRNVDVLFRNNLSKVRRFKFSLSSLHHIE